MAKRNMKKVIIYTLSIIVALPLLLLLVCNGIVKHNAAEKVFDHIEDIAPAEYGLLLGTTPQSQIGGVNAFFIHRIEATVALYEAGKIKKILISGDDNSLGGVDEPQCMKDTLVAKGIPSEAILLDGKGLSTIDSVERANQLYGIRTFIIISQQFHNERAVYLAEHLELDIDHIQAFNATSPTTRWATKTYIREYFARVKMFMDIIVK